MITRFSFFIIVCIVSLGSCSKEDDELQRLPNLTNGETVFHTNYSEDSVYKFTVSPEKLEKARVDGPSLQIIKERAYHVLTKQVNSGYGQMETVSFNRLFVSVYANTVAVFATAEGTGDALLTIFDYNLDSITSMYLTQQQQYARWNWGSFYIASDGQANYYTERGVLQKTISAKHGIWAPSFTDIVLDSENFLSFVDAGIYKQVITGRYYWYINLYDVVKNKAGMEMYAPEIDFQSKTVVGKTLTVVVHVTYYSGEKETLTYKINIDTGKLV